MSQGSPGDCVPPEPTSAPSAPPNPFVHELHLSRLQRIKFCLLGTLLAPIRVLLAFIVLFLLWPFAWLQVAGLSEEQLQEPLTGWRKLYPELRTFPYLSLEPFFASTKPSSYPGTTRPLGAEWWRKSEGGLPQEVLFFPEGTCSNKKALLKFKPGAFIAGVPVQPVLIRYPNSLDTTSWAWRGPGVLKVLWLTASQPCSIVDVEFLPVYHPSPEESRDPTLYANNVQRVMAQALGIPATECEFVGSLPVIVVGRLKVALEPKLWELGKILCKAGLSPGCVDTGAEPGRSRMINQDEFAGQLQLSDPQAVASAFSYFQKDANGLVDFRDVALALAALDGGTDLEELTRLAFELFAEEPAEGPGHLLCKDGFSTILHLLLGSPRPAAEALHADLCQAGPHQGLSLCQFQDFFLRDPVHRKLFSTYLRPSQTPNASSPGSPTALANGTVHMPKHKGD
ncbi:lysophospholipid acyltransferase LPCAT4 isoform X3 [Sturnira hondurensis]|uniref:lysophospholipid acyltransferase LPCAT4 isoform X3 n=1 Tax=Sturnira hondurensis TaxID=192404 RepID=UPI00187A3D33|nr:lysophospholipid acyltransferase LPCAT4 isoform X3 [Sturnira hondurensis]